MLRSLVPIRAIRDIRGQICKKRCLEELEGYRSMRNHTVVNVLEKQRSRSSATQRI